MSVGVLGCGWVTPLGTDIDVVIRGVQNGERPEPAMMQNPYSGKKIPFLRVTEADLAPVAKIPRLRRSSIISHLAMTAALNALQDAGIAVDDPDCRLALVFAASDGGVIYTRKFFGELVAQGTQAGSPILFPETVYNAPASHIAARLGITGTVSTVVGDATAGVHALAFAEDLLMSGDCDVCLVVAAEEIDWIVAEAYSVWGVGAEHGIMFSESAAAIVLADTGKWSLEMNIGKSFTSTMHARQSLAGAMMALPECKKIATVVGSVSGGKFDVPEVNAIDDVFGGVGQIHPKMVLGEAFAASTLSQVIFATRYGDAMGHLPVVIPVVGWNGQSAAARLQRR